MGLHKSLNPLCFLLEVYSRPSQPTLASAEADETPTISYYTAEVAEGVEWPGRSALCECACVGGQLRLEYRNKKTKCADRKSIFHVMFRQQINSPGNCLSTPLSVALASFGGHREVCVCGGGCCTLIVYRLPSVNTKNNTNERF